MKILALASSLALVVALTACGGGGKTPKASSPGAAESVAQGAVQQASVEEILTGIYNRMGLESVTVSYQSGVVRVAFEQPYLPVAAMQALYLEVLDVAALNAPFSQQVAMAAKVNRQPLVGISGRTEDIRAFRQEQLKSEDYIKRLTYSIAPK